MIILEVRDFVTQTDWLCERREPRSAVFKRNWLAKMNDDTESDIAGITYNLGSDMVDLWYTKINPFREYGTQVIIPGWTVKIIELEALYGSQN